LPVAQRHGGEAVFRDIGASVRPTRSAVVPSIITDQFFVSQPRA
jgi:hypothetical protein